MHSGASTPTSDLQQAALSSVPVYTTPEKLTMDRLGSYPIVFEENYSSDQDSD